MTYRAPINAMLLVHGQEGRLNPWTAARNKSVDVPSVIASEAKQSRKRRGEWTGLLRRYTPRSDKTTIAEV